MIGIAIGLVVVLVAVGIHYEGLRLCSILVGRMKHLRRSRLAVAMFGAFLTHLVEIVVFAIAIGLMIRAGLGDLQPPPNGFMDLMYFSAVNYTTIGYGDQIPLGPMRHIAGLEALTGLVMIAWTASFSVFQMEHNWGR